MLKVALLPDVAKSRLIFVTQLLLVLPKSESRHGVRINQLVARFAPAACFRALLLARNRAGHGPAGFVQSPIAERIVGQDGLGQRICHDGATVSAMLLLVAMPNALLTMTE